MQPSDSDLFPVIPYYNIVELLGDSLNALIYKAEAKDNPGRFFVIKILKRLINSTSQCHFFTQKIERLKIALSSHWWLELTWPDYLDIDYLYNVGKGVKAILVRGSINRWLFVESDTFGGDGRLMVQFESDTFVTIKR